MHQNYELKLYDDTLLSFERGEGSLGGYNAVITAIGGSRRLLPLDLELTGDGMMEWLQRRVIPKNRAFVDEIPQSLGLSSRDTMGIIDVCKLRPAP